MSIGTQPINSMPTEMASDLLLNMLLSEFEKIGKHLNVQVPTCSPDIYKDFLALPDKRREKINEDVAIACQVSRGLLEENIPASGINLSQEVRLLKLALEKFGLKIKDPGFIERLDEGDIIEVYNSEGIQLYRSWSFFKICSYSLVDLLVYDWNTLYERPVSIVNSLMELAPKLFQPETMTVPYGLPDYILIERYRERNRALNVKMKLASPLIDKKTGATVAFLSTAVADLMPFSQDSASLSFI